MEVTLNKLGTGFLSLWVRDHHLYPESIEFRTAAGWNRWSPPTAVASQTMLGSGGSRSSESAVIRPS